MDTVDTQVPDIDRRSIVLGTQRTVVGSRKLEVNDEVKESSNTVSLIEAIVMQREEGADVERG